MCKKPDAVHTLCSCVCNKTAKVRLHYFEKNAHASLFLHCKSKFTVTKVACSRQHQRIQFMAGVSSKRAKLHYRLTEVCYVSRSWANLQASRNLQKNKQASWILNSTRLSYIKEMLLLSPCHRREWGDWHPMSFLKATCPVCEVEYTYRRVSLIGSGGIHFWGKAHRFTHFIELSSGEVRCWVNINRIAAKTNGELKFHLSNFFQVLGLCLLNLSTPHRHYLCLEPQIVLFCY